MAKQATLFEAPEALPNGLVLVRDFIDAAEEARLLEGIQALELPPRSAHVLRDEVRWRWQHSVVATKALRYSITFRTRRTKGPSPRRTPNEEGESGRPPDPREPR